MNTPAFTKANDQPAAALLPLRSRRPKVKINFWPDRERGAFLGLCEEGLIKGIPSGQYMASRDDKAYAVRAAALLAEGAQSWSVNSFMESGQ